MAERISGTPHFQQHESRDLSTDSTGAEGSYRGQKVSLRPDAASLVADAAEELSFGASEKVEKKLSKRKLGKKGGAKSSAMERAEFYLKKLPDLGDVSKLKRFCDHLKKQGELLPQQFRQEAGKFFKDVSHQFGALSYARDIFAQEKGQEAKNRQLRAAVDQLVREQGPSVKAGMNVSETAARFAEQGLGEIQELRDLYRETVLEYDGIKETYADILDNMDYYVCSKCRTTTMKKEVEECPGCGATVDQFVYNDAEFVKTVNFLLKSVSIDLESQGPSVDPAALKKIIDDLYQLEVLGTMHESCSELLAKVQKQFDLAQRAFAPDLIQTVLNSMDDTWLRTDLIHALVTKVGATNAVAQIYFIRELKDFTRMIPVKIFENSEKRENLLTVIQDALDEAIGREEEEL